MRRGLVALLCLAGVGPSAGWVQQRPSLVRAPSAPALTGHALQPARHAATPSARRAVGAVKEPSPLLGAGYTVVGVVTLLAWIGCVLVTVTHPRLKLLPPYLWLTIAQALTPVPLAFAVLKSIRDSAAKEGWWAMGRSTYRRINLGITGVSLWLAAAAYFGPKLSMGLHIYSDMFARLICSVHLASAAFCLFVWARVVKPSPGAIGALGPIGYIPRLVRGVLGSIWGLLPSTPDSSAQSGSGSATRMDDPDSKEGQDGRNEYAVACALFLYFAAMPFFVGFPTAVVPTFLGIPLSRAAGAWTLLSAVAAYVLKDASQRGRIHSGSTFRYLRRGFVASSGLHLAVMGAKMYITGGFHPRLMRWWPSTYACPKIAAASLVMHALVVFAALTPPPKVAKPKTGGAVAAAATATPVAVAVTSAPPAPPAPKPQAAPAPPKEAAKPKAEKPKGPSLADKAMGFLNGLNYKPTKKVEKPKAAKPQGPSMPAKAMGFLKTAVTGVGGKKQAPAPKINFAAPAAAPVAPKPAPAAAPAPVFNMGDRVTWNGKVGTVRYKGGTAFAPGEWIGVELDAEGGVHNGYVMGQRYFACAPGRGVFAQAAGLRHSEAAVA